jgi:hypothetical protein
VIRAPFAESAFHGVDALAKGGITGIEITFSTPDAPDIIDLLRQRFGDSVLIGAGSIVQPSQAIEAAQAGASFLVSPGRLRVRCEGHHRNGPHHHPPRADAQQSYGCQRRRRRRHQDLSGLLGSDASVSITAESVKPKISDQVTCHVITRITEQTIKTRFGRPSGPSALSGENGRQQCWY